MKYITNIDLNSLIKFSDKGVIVASFPETYTSISNSFKAIYGSDIDLSTNSADGIYVRMYSEIVYNILKSIQQLYGSLDVNTAKGIFLERLCALSNVYRKQATNSTASITVTLDASETTSFKTNSISFLDNNGNTWSANTVEQMVFEPGTPQTIIVTCDESGPIEAVAGSITTPLNMQVLMTVTQENDALPGTSTETDNQLRERRSTSASKTGSSILESLSGALLDVTGINDVRIYNNNTLSDVVAKDGTVIEPHSTYVIIRQDANSNIAESLIGSIIYEKMTPGILTTQTTDDTTGEDKSFNYQQYVSGEVLLPDIYQTVYWKQATSIAPQIVITLSITNNFATNNNSTAMRIKQFVENYCNNLRISENINLDILKSTIINADPQYLGSSTYSLTSVTINGVANNYVNPDTYFNYSNISVSKSGTTYTITLS